MNTAQDVKAFIGQKRLAIVGVSRNNNAFSAVIFKDLKQKGYEVIPVNPLAEKIGDDTCYPSLGKIPGKVGGVLILTPASETEKIVREAYQLGIGSIWIQQGAGSTTAEAFCREKGLSVVNGECILMFAEPVGALHGIHRFIAKLLGKLPR